MLIHALLLSRASQILQAGPLDQRVQALLPKAGAPPHLGTGSMTQQQLPEASSSARRAATRRPAALAGPRAAPLQTPGQQMPLCPDVPDSSDGNIYQIKCSGA